MTVSAPTKGVSLSELAARISDCNVAKRTPFEFDAAGAGPTPMVTQRERDALEGLDPDGAFDAETAIKSNSRNSA